MTDIAALPDHALRRYLLEHLSRRDPVPIQVAALRRMILDDRGLDLVRERLAAG